MVTKKVPLQLQTIIDVLKLWHAGKDEDDITETKKLQKLERKKFHKEQEVVFDEMLPKATGREALLEKKALRREQARAREDSPEMKERDVMGGGDDFQKRYSSLNSTIIMALFCVFSPSVSDIHVQTVPSNSYETQSCRIQSM